MWIVVRCMSIQVACNEQFDVIIKELDPKFPRMPDKEIQGTILQKHLQAIDQLKSICPPRVATTIDFWSRLDTEEFGTLTFLATEGVCVRSTVLGCYCWDQR